MSCYISSKENRFYAALEQSYGNAALISEADRLPAVKLQASQTAERLERRDKTGSRTFAGLASGRRNETRFRLSTYMMSWPLDRPEPFCGVLVHAAMGAPPLVFAGGSVQSISGMQLTLAAAHDLTIGQAVSIGGELRFISAVVDAQTVVLNAPLTEGQASGWPVDRTVTYRLQSNLPSVSIYDYWSPDSSVQRVVTGCGVDELSVRINSDFHEFGFAGPASDIVDSASFVSGEAGMVQFPAEPSVVQSAYAVVPGNLGQAWLGYSPDRFYTLTGAEVTIGNNMDLRAREFGMSAPRCLVPGMRDVKTTFSLYEKPDTATKALYQASRQKSPISVMFQLGQQVSQLCGVYMKSVVPEVPGFSDDDPQLEWRFSQCRAEGIVDDEVYIAFG